MLRRRFTKIIATLGPVSSTKDSIKNLFKSGADVFRLNFSHGTHELHAQNIQYIREIEHEMKHPITIIADMQGPKFRVGTFTRDKAELVAGQTFTFDLNTDPGNGARVNLPHPELYKSVKAGQELLVDDGRLAFRVDFADESVITTKVLVGGFISNRKGVNLPECLIPVRSLTAKDHKDLIFALDKDVDWIALSFVQTAEDIQEARQYIKDKAKIMAKIEKPQAIENLDAILKEVDAIMIARGDLGVEFPPEKVPPLQRQIIKACHKERIPVIVATQMLESMVENPMPTRAEASDVANAVYSKVDAVMLSAETAAGKHPVEAVGTMERIIINAEKDADPVQLPSISSSSRNAIAAAATHIAASAKAKAIAVLTLTGDSAIQLSQNRPNVPVVAFSPHLKTVRQLNLLRNVYAIHEKFPTNDISIWVADQVYANGIAGNTGKDSIVLVTNDSYIQNQNAIQLINV